MPVLAPRRARPETEAALLLRVKHALNRMEGVVVWRCARGFDEARMIRYGLAPGCTDLVGIVRVDGIGVALFVEVKSRDGALEPNQETFGRVVRGLGAIHIVARSAEAAVAAVEVARELVREREWMRNGKV